MEQAHFEVVEFSLELSYASVYPIINSLGYEESGKGVGQWSRWDCKSNGGDRSFGQRRGTCSYEHGWRERNCIVRKRRLQYANLMKVCGVTTTSLCHLKLRKRHINYLIYESTWQPYYPFWKNQS